MIGIGIGVPLSDRIYVSLQNIIWFFFKDYKLYIDNTNTIILSL